MTRPSFSRLIAVVTAAASLAAMPACAADAWPNHAIRFVVPVAPGGAVDALARQMAQKITADWNVPVVVDNKPGAGTIVGTEYVAKAAPDGYTFGFVISSHLANPALYAKLPYDTLKDFAPVSLLVTGPLVLVVNQSLPVTTLPELIAYTKANPGKVSYATGSIADVGQLTGENLKLATGMKMEHVPYRGAAAALTDLLGNTINVMINTPAMMMPLIASGKLKALAVTSAARSDALPAVPSIAEAINDKSFDMSTFYGLLAPAATPPAIVEKMSAEVARIMKMPDVRDAMLQQGFLPVGSTPQALEAYIAKGVVQSAAVVQRAHLHAE